MAGPFSNSTDGEIFLSARCNRCKRRNTEDGGMCDEAFFPVMDDQWPPFFERVIVSRHNILGVECNEYDYDALASEG